MDIDNISDAEDSENLPTSGDEARPRSREISMNFLGVPHFSG